MRACISDQIIEIRSVIRRVRGGSQGLLVQGEDNRFYIAKFQGNPQGTRTLINEWIANRICERLEISTPCLRRLHLGESVLQQSRNLLHFSMGGDVLPIQPGVHLGSVCPVDPNQKAIYDFLPRKMLRQVRNPEDFIKSFVLDLWLGQKDRRQAIFLRDAAAAGSYGFRAYMIDHGLAFSGSDWGFSEGELPAYWDRTVYSLVDSPKLCRETVSEIERLTAEEIESFTAVPEVWLSPADQVAFVRLISELDERRAMLACLLENKLRLLHGEVVAKKGTDRPFELSIIPSRATCDHPAA